MGRRARGATDVITIANVAYLADLGMPFPAFESLGPNRAARACGLWTLAACDILDAEDPMARFCPRDALEDLWDAGAATDLVALGLFTEGLHGGLRGYYLTNFPWPANG